ncbi:MAG: hypothetical protein OEM81_09310 [Acidimicrobiia bacterium]|nr:hypothetical protein [Acidimicrobiia bacterium]MDH5615798.1 hypothetical protein [Acidimicrobiia bacterium]
MTDVVVELTDVCNDMRLQQKRDQATLDSRPPSVVVGKSDGRHNAG